MTVFLFVGEQPSPTARRRSWSWRSGRLCARTLFDALRSCGLNPGEQHYRNILLPSGEVDASLLELVLGDFHTYGYALVALGRKVAAILAEKGLPHLRLIHPAARGRIRLRENYQKHVRSVLEAHLKKRNDE